MTTWLTTAEVAALSGVDERSVRRRAIARKYECRRAKSGRNANAIEISIASLSPEEKAAYFATHPRLVKSSPADELPPPVFAFDNATDNQKRRAVAREAAVIAFETHINEWGSRRGITAAKETWAREIAATIPGIGAVSVDSLERWRQAYAAYKRNGLVDRNDGSARRGKSVVPSRVREYFIARYTDGTVPTKATAIFEARAFAELQLKTPIDHVADDAFNRIHIPEALLRQTRGDQDKEERVILTLRRDHNFPALHIVVTDHHVTDRWVHCGEEAYVFAKGALVHVPAGRKCGPDGCKHGHRVWITGFMDVASRAVLTTIVSLDYPNSDTIRRGLRILIEKHGLPNLMYCDNGKDYKSAFGRAIRRGEASPLDENLLNNLLASLGMRVIFALPRKGRSKNIERLFGTWVRQIWQGHAAYVGSLGKRTDRAKELYHQPENLLSLDEFRAEFDLQIEAYNIGSEHRGQGMNRRAPLDVFEATRIPRRDPEHHGFEIAFWSWYGRQVHAGGTVSIGSDRYVLDPIVGASMIGKKVQLLVNPQDVRRAIVLSGCEHTDSKLARSKSLRCSCAGKGAFLCEATFDRLSSYVDGEVTAEALRERDRVNRELRTELRRYRSPRAQRDLAAMRADGGLGMLRAIVEKMRERRRQQPAAVATGGEGNSTLLLPQSQIARRVEEYRDRISNPFQLSASEREETAAVELPSNAAISMMAEAPRLHAVEYDDHFSAKTALDEIEIERMLREREVAGFCSASLDCPNDGAPFCLTHQKEFTRE